MNCKDTVNKINDENADQDFFSAIKICKKMSPARTADNESLFYKKIYLYLQEMDLILKHLKRLWIWNKMIF